MSTAPLSRIALYYRFTPLADPEAVRLWQRTLAASLGLTGRIIVSPQGINGTVGGPVDAVKRYVRGTREHPAFRDLEVKWSDGSAADFPRLSVKVKPELVAFGAPERVTVDADGVVGTGERLTPVQVDALVAERAGTANPVRFLDGRNTVEAAIGCFDGAVVPDAHTTRDLLAAVDSGALDHLKDAPLITYCTGGVRCEVLSALLKDRGFAEVYQLDGGIVRYGETFGSSGYWDGSLYVFDKRMHVEFGDNVESIGHCVSCDKKTPEFVNCANLECRKQYLRCTDCTDKGLQAYCADCAEQGIPAEAAAG